MIKHNKYTSSEAPRPRNLRRSDVGYALIPSGDNESVLMVCNRRSSGLSWSFPGGSREPGETLAETVVRETLEETGLRIAVDGIVALGERLRRSHVLIATFSARVLSGSPSVQNSDDEVVAVEWVGLREAESLMPWYPGGIESLVSKRGAVHYGEFLY